ncbi:MAG: AAA family ATPase [Pseudomonadota bacterium]
MSGPQTIILSGTVGAGKTTVGLAAQELLAARKIPSAFLDVDQFTYLWPETDPFNQELAFESLRSLWPVYANRGAERLILARVVITTETLERYARELGGAEITLVRITAPLDVRVARLKQREYGESQRWHLERTSELDEILIAAGIEDHVIANEGDTPAEAAEAVLRRCGWI